MTRLKIIAFDEPDWPEQNQLKIISYGNQDPYFNQIYRQMIQNPGFAKHIQNTARNYLESLHNKIAMQFTSSISESRATFQQLVQTQHGLIAEFIDEEIKHGLKMNPQFGFQNHNIKGHYHGATTLRDVAILDYRLELEAKYENVFQQHIEARYNISAEWNKLLAAFQSDDPANIKPNTSDRRSELAFSLEQIDEAKRIIKETVENQELLDCILKVLDSGDTVLRKESIVVQGALSGLLENFIQDNGDSYEAITPTLKYEKKWEAVTPPEKNDIDTCMKNVEKAVAAGINFVVTNMANGLHTHPGIDPNDIDWDNPIKAIRQLQISAEDISLADHDTYSGNYVVKVALPTTDNRAILVTMEFNIETYEKIMSHFPDDIKEVQGLQSTVKMFRASEMENSPNEEIIKFVKDLLIKTLKDNIVLLAEDSKYLSISEWDQILKNKEEFELLKDDFPTFNINKTLLPDFATLLEKSHLEKRIDRLNAAIKRIEETIGTIRSQDAQKQLEGKKIECQKTIYACSKSLKEINENIYFEGSELQKIMEDHAISNIEIISDSYLTDYPEDQREDIKTLLLQLLAFKNEPELYQTMRRKLRNTIVTLLTGQRTPLDLKDLEKDLATIYAFVNNETIEEKTKIKLVDIIIKSSGNDSIKLKNIAEFITVINDFLGKTNWEDLEVYIDTFNKINKQEKISDSVFSKISNCKSLEEVIAGLGNNFEQIKLGITNLKAIIEDFKKYTPTELLFEDTYDKDNNSVLISGSDLDLLISINPNLPIKLGYSNLDMLEDRPQSTYSNILEEHGRLLRDAGEKNKKQNTLFLRLSSRGFELPGATITLKSNRNYRVYLDIGKQQEIATLLAAIKFDSIKKEPALKDHKSIMDNISIKLARNKLSAHFEKHQLEFGALSLRDIESLDTPEIKSQLEEAGLVRAITPYYFAGLTHNFRGNANDEITIGENTSGLLFEHAMAMGYINKHGEIINISGLETDPLLGGLFANIPVSYRLPQNANKASILEEVKKIMGSLSIESDKVIKCLMGQLQNQSEYQLAAKIAITRAIFERRLEIDENGNIELNVKGENSLSRSIIVHIGKTKVLDGQNNNGAYYIRSMYTKRNNAESLFDTKAERFKI